MSTSHGGPKGIGADRAQAFDQVGVEQAEDIRSVQVCVPGDTPRQKEPHARTFDRSLGELTASSGDREAFDHLWRAWRRYPALDNVRLDHVP
jgi:hypothetical protein